MDTVHVSSDPVFVGLEVMGRDVYGNMNSQNRQKRTSEKHGCKSSMCMEDASSVFTSLCECDRWLLRQSPAGGTSLVQTLEMALSGDSYNRGMYMTITSYAMYIHLLKHIHTHAH